MSEPCLTPNKWKINKDVSIGDLVAFGTALFAVAYSYFTLDTRVRLIEQALTQISTDQHRQDSERVNIRLEIRQELREVNSKLDSIIKDAFRPK